MALRRKHSVERTGVELLRAWAAASGGAPVGVSGRLRDAAEDLAIAADRRPGDLVAAASRFGWQAGDDGWPLAEIARWLETLARISGPSGKGLLTYEVAVALSAGWADGFLHGASRDAIAYARKVAEAEINAATDNPLFFPGDETPPLDHEFAANWPAGYDGRERISYSAGNFHGEPVGMAADVLAIALAELANISERRAQMLLDGHHNRSLPPNLIPHRGINSGLMIIQYCAAGIVSENKVLTHPASVDSIPTSSNSEDHNAMATIAARKARTVLRNAQSVLAIELLVAAQAVEWRVAMEIDPARPRPVASTDWEQANREAEQFEERTRPERRQEIAEPLGEGTRRLYLQVREAAPTMLRDRMLEGDIRAVLGLVAGH